MSSALRRNTLFSFLSAAFRLSANAVLFVLVARYYGPEGFGQFTAAHTLSTIFILFADFGFDLFVTTEVARQPDKSSEIVARMAAIKLIFTMTATIGMATFAFIQDLSLMTKQLAYIFCFYMFFSALLNFTFALFRAHEQMHVESFITLVINAVLVVALIFLGAFGADLRIVALAFALSRVLALILAVQRSARFVSSIFPIVDKAWIVATWKQTSVFGLFVIFGNLFYTQDTILLSLWKGDYYVGVYQSVFRIIALALIIPEILFNAILPALSRLYDNDRKGWAGLGNFVSKTLFFVGLLVGSILIIVPEIVIGMAYGEKHFQEAIPVMRVFGLIVIVRYMFEVPALMLTTSRRQKTRTFLVIGATIFNFILNMYAIPRFGILGVAIVSFATNTLVGIGYAVATKNVFPQQWLNSQRLLPLLVITAGYLVLQCLSFPPTWVSLLLLAACYLSVVYFVGFTPSDRSRMSGLVLGFETK